MCLTHGCATMSRRPLRCGPRSAKQYRRLGGAARWERLFRRWLAGLYDNNRFNRRSYASGYPETGDLYLAVQLKINPVTGEFINDNGSTRPVAIIGHPGLLVRWEEIEYLNFQEY
jgi:hypothetical protein